MMIDSAHGPIIPVILSGGTGSRLWPLSRAIHPKQFFPLVGDLTLLQTTAQRLAAIQRASAPMVVCNETHRFLVLEQLKELGVAPTAILLESAGRNSAPAITAAALEALANCGNDDNPVLLIFPIDHVIQDSERFADAVQAAIIEADAGHLVTFGIHPTMPATGYGYINASTSTENNSGALRVELFVEKPDKETATNYLKDGNYYWNSGMFVFGAKQYLRELQQYAPEVLEAVTVAHQKANKDLDFLRLDSAAFSESPAISVDHAVMERTSEAVMVPLDAGWCDIGSWAALAQISEPDESGNSSKGDVLFERTRNTFVHGGNRLIAVVGGDELVIADTPDALLVAHKNAVDSVKDVVATLEASGREEHQTHRVVHRPWGLFEVLLDGNGFKIKRIVVNPGQTLSLQSHRHRAEHWIVVRGAAEVTRGEETFTVCKNESTYISPQTKHRLQNLREDPLELVEVQTGDYLGEDDIIRHEDVYGRISSD